MQPAHTYKVLIIDDHALIREGLKQIIADSGDFIVTGEADSGLRAVQCMRTENFDLVLLDISLPDKNGIDVLRQIKKEYPGLPVLMLSMHREDQYAVRAMRAGAAGYLNKQSAPDDLIQAMRIITSGRKYITPSLAQEMASRLNDEMPQIPHATLSDREYQTLIMIASGRTVGQIAIDLSLSVKEGIRNFVCEA